MLFPMHHLINMSSLLYVNYKSIKLLKIHDFISYLIFEMHFIIITCLHMRKLRPREARGLLQFIHFRLQTKAPASSAPF